MSATTPAVRSHWASPSRTRSGAGSPSRRVCRPKVRRYAGPEPLFLKTRSDRQVRIAVKFLHRALQYQGFAPYAGYSFEWNRSNIPINTYRNHGAVFGISKTF